MFTHVTRMGISNHTSLLLVKFVMTYYIFLYEYSLKALLYIQSGMCILYLRDFVLLCSVSIYQMKINYLLTYLLTKTNTYDFRDDCICSVLGRHLQGRLSRPVPGDRVARGLLTPGDLHGMAQERLQNSWFGLG